ncbi:hypothetical protein ccbrp13_45430 [Ktedonobacteria bacterium brp13]|nr:hypothetical protein ccbrp13_45430 [Ktedonobacteria bacterium brp13]
MYIEMYTFKVGNFKFTVELDTGAEVGEHQLILWYSEKKDITTIPLKEIESTLLLKALKEPYYSQFTYTLKEMKSNQALVVERDIYELQRPFLGSSEQKACKLPADVKRQIKQLRQHLQSTIKQIERHALRDELLTLERDGFVLERIAQECKIYHEARFLRDFFFEEATEKHIQNFCQQFAHDPTYRQQVLHGETHWYKRNALFLRNLNTVLGEYTLLADDGSAMRKAREFFRWLDRHTEEILALPAYQRLVALDGNDPEQPCRPDAQIGPAIDLLLQLPGTSINHSCQGVSGKVAFQEQEQGYTLLTITHHAEYANVTFKTLSLFTHDIILARLKEYPSITIERIPCNFAQDFVLRSTGDNLRFREELLALARNIQASIRESEGRIGPAGPVKTVSRWIHTAHPESCPETAEPGGMLAIRRQWLCQGQQLEHTLQLLYHLNHWAKASDQLFYIDRQGLYSIKSALLQECYRQGSIQISGYIEGVHLFVQSMTCQIAADLASETVLCRLSEIEQETQDEEELWALALYQQATGNDYLAQIQNRESEDYEENKEAIKEGETAQLESYIYSTLVKLLELAEQTRQPISIGALSELCIYPTDLLNIHYSRSRYINTWHDLDESDLRKLDPEGWSLISFHYTNELTQYTFHLPYRIAESFLDTAELERLRKEPVKSREEGLLYGRVISEQESEQFPIASILDALQVNITHICPKALERKTEQYSNSWHGCTEDLDDDDDNEEDDWSPEDYQDDGLPKKSHSRNKHTCSQAERLEKGCPRCQQKIAEFGLARVEHWQQMHKDEDLTYRKVLWILGMNEHEFKQLHITPDYRQDDKPDGTRYWKICTLAKVVELLGDKNKNEQVEHNAV